MWVGKVYTAWEQEFSAGQLSKLWLVISLCISVSFSVKLRDSKLPSPHWESIIFEVKEKVKNLQKGDSLKDTL